MRAGRLAKAHQFQLAADTIETILDDEEIADAYITLCVHAGIAAADVICCARLGRHHQGEDHHGAVALLASVDRTAANYLKRLLDMKTRAGYGATAAALADQKRAGRAASALVRAAERI
ncbi:MAG: hypothetical protein ACRDT2_22250 [Natronosporangium sp.]